MTKTERELLAEVEAKGVAVCDFCFGLTQKKTLQFWMVGKRRFVAAQKLISKGLVTLVSEHKLDAPGDHTHTVKIGRK